MKLSTAFIFSPVNAIHVKFCSKNFVGMALTGEFLQPNGPEKC